MNFGKNLDNNPRHKAPERIVVPTPERAAYTERVRGGLDVLARTMALFPPEVLEQQFEQPPVVDTPQQPPVVESVNPFYTMTTNVEALGQEALRRA